MLPTTVGRQKVSPQTASATMRNLLVFTALVEAVAGGALIASPAQPVALLIGATLDTPGGMIAARVAGAALLALGLACWMARDDGQSRAARGLVVAMLVYNVAVAGVLAYAGVGLKLSAIGLWPAVLLHVGLAVWCVVAVRFTNVANPPWRK